MLIMHAQVARTNATTYDCDSRLIWDAQAQSVEQMIGLYNSAESETGQESEDVVM